MAQENVKAQEGARAQENKRTKSCNSAMVQEHKKLQEGTSVM